MQSSLPPLPPLSAVQSITIPSDLDAVRSKLVQLIDVLSTLLAQLHYLSLTSPEPSTAHPGILPYTDLLNRYNLVLSHVSSLGALLSSQNDSREKERKGKDKGRDPKKEKWSASAVAPAIQVEADRDWIVGMLLRTKQVRSHCWLAKRLVLSLSSWSSSSLGAHSMPLCFARRGHVRLHKSRHTKPTCSGHCQRHSTTPRPTNKLWRHMTN